MSSREHGRPELAEAGHDALVIVVALGLAALSGAILMNTIKSSE
jgi:hypothetical protein